MLNRQSLRTSLTRQPSMRLLTLGTALATAVVVGSLATSCGIRRKPADPNAAVFTAPATTDDGSDLKNLSPTLPSTTNTVPGQAPATVPAPPSVVPPVTDPTSVVPPVIDPAPVVSPSPDPTPDPSPVSDSRFQTIALDSVIESSLSGKADEARTHLQNTLASIEADPVQVKLFADTVAVTAGDASTVSIVQKGGKIVAVALGKFSTLEQFIARLALLKQNIEDIASGNPIMPPAPAIDPTSIPAIKKAIAELPVWNRKLMKPGPDAKILHAFGSLYSSLAGSPLHSDYLDFAAPAGSPVYAANIGIVTQVQLDLSVCGTGVTIRHSADIYTQYCHLASVAVKRGMKVSTATVIGTVGSTGFTQGAMLSLGLNSHGVFTNPAPFIVSSGAAIDSTGPVTHSPVTPSTLPAAKKSGKLMGRFKATRYWTAMESNFKGQPRTVALRDRHGHLIAMVSAKFATAMSMEGSGELVAHPNSHIAAGTTINWDGSVNGQDRYRILHHEFGEDGRLCSLIPFRTIAVDPDGPIKIGDKVFIVETQGMKLPDGTLHNGVWFAQDTGSAIQGPHVDLFVGKGDHESVLAPAFKTDDIKATIQLISHPAKAGACPTLADATP